MTENNDTRPVPAQPATVKPAPITNVAPPVPEQPVPTKPAPVTNVAPPVDVAELENAHEQATARPEISVDASAGYDYLIVGNSAAGVAAAESIRAHDEASSICMVSNETHHAYSTPLISYLIEGETTEAKMQLRDEDFYRRNHIVCRFGVSVEQLDAVNKKVMLGDETCLGYGKVLFATGSTPMRLSVAGLAYKQNVFSFLTLADAEGIAARADACMARPHDAKSEPVRAIIVGAGLIGLKAAEGLVGRVDEVIVLVRSARILRTTVDEDASRMLIHQLARRGVQILTDLEITAGSGKGGFIDRVMLNDGSSMACSLVIVAPGVRPNDEMVVEAGAEAGKGLVCGEDMQTTLPDVYAAGDCTQSYDVLNDIERCLAIWPNAVAQGRVAGACMSGGDAAFEGGFGVNAFGFFGMSVITCGVVNPDDSYDAQVFSDESQYRKFVVRDDCLCGYILVNAPENAGIYTMLIREKVPVSQLAPDTFARGIGFTDLPYELRTSMLRKGLDGKEAC